VKIRIVRLLTVVVFLVLLCGCIPSVELNQRAIVQAIGIDIEKEGYRVTFQIFSPEGGGDSGVDASKQNAKVISAEGKTISDAIQNATLQQGKKIFYGHNRLLIIGEETAKRGVREILPFFNNGYQSRPNTDVMIAEGTAEAVLTANITQGIVPAESLQNMIENHTENGSVLQTRLLDVIEAVYDESKTVAIPKIKPTEEAKASMAQEENKEEKVEPTQLMIMDGTAILKSEKLVGYLNESETRGLLWLTGKVHQTLVVFPYQSKLDHEEHAVSVEVHRSETKTDVSIRNGKATFKVEIQAEGRVNELGLNDAVIGAEEMERLEQQAEAVIKKECELCFTKAAKAYRTDPFLYGKLLSRAENSFWQMQKKTWPERIAETTLQVVVQFHIDRFGLQADNRKQ